MLLPLAFYRLRYFGETVAGQINQAMCVVTDGKEVDKLKYGAAKNELLNVQRALQAEHNMVTIQLFSSHTRSGIEALEQRLNSWLCPRASEPCAPTHSPAD